MDRRPQIGCVSNSVLLACLVVGLTAIICSVYLPSLYGFVEGRPAPRTVVAGKTVTALDAPGHRESEGAGGPVGGAGLYPRPQALTKATTDLEGFLQQAGRLREGLVRTPGLAKALAELQRVAPVTTSAATLEYLLTADSGTYDQVQRQALGALKTLYASRITDASLESRSSYPPVHHERPGRVAALPPTAVYEVTAGFVRPNQVVDEAQTLARRQAAMDEVAPVMVTIREG